MTHECEHEVGSAWIGRCGDQLDHHSAHLETLDQQIHGQEILLSNEIAVLGIMTEEDF
jgi:hypothetical protein